MLLSAPLLPQGILKSAHEITANMAAGRDAKAAQATGYGYVQVCSRSILLLLLMLPHSCTCWR